MTKKISILWATGSVGTQAIDVAESRGYKIDFMSAGSDFRALERMARKFSPAAVAMADEESDRKSVV